MTDKERIVLLEKQLASLKLENEKLSAKATGKAVVEELVIPPADDAPDGTLGKVVGVRVSNLTGRKPIDLTWPVIRQLSEVFPQIADFMAKHSGK